MTENDRIASAWLSVRRNAACAFGLALAQAGADRARWQTRRTPRRARRRHHDRCAISSSVPKFILGPQRMSPGASPMEISSGYDVVVPGAGGGGGGMTAACVA